MFETPTPRSFPAFAEFLAPLLEPGEVGEIERLVEILHEIAAVVGIDEAGLERHGARRNGVAAAQLDRIELHGLGRLLDHGLDHIGRLGPPGAAVMAGQHRVRHHARHLGVNGGRRIGAGEHAQIDERRPRGAVRCVIGPDIGERLDPQRQEFSVAVERQLGVGHVVARLLVRDEAFGALGDPFDRPPGEARGKRRQHVLVVERALHAEAAAHVVALDAHPRLRHLQEAGENAARAVRRLHRAADDIAVVVPVELGQAPARLHRIGGDAVDHHAVLHDMRGLGEGGLDRGLVADFVEPRRIAGAILPHRRRAGLHRVLGADHGRQRLVIDRDELGRVLRLGQCLGDDEGDAFADIAHAPLRQRRLRADEAGRAVAAFSRHARALPSQRLHRLVLARQHQKHARRRLGRRRVDRADAGVRMGRAQHHGARLARKIHVLDIAAFAAQQIGVFLARYRLTHSELAHVLPSLLRDRTGLL